MIKRYDGAKAVKTVGKENLPAGGYVAKIMGAKVQEYDWGEVLIVSLDIAEGEHKDFFTNDYRNNPNEDKKWRGTYRINIPNESNKYFEGQKRTFNNFIYALESSNNGFHFDWDESKLKGLMLGVLYRNREYEVNGNTGWMTESCAVLEVADIRENKFKMPTDKPLANKSTAAASTKNDIWGAVANAGGSDEEDLPF